MHYRKITDKPLPGQGGEKEEEAKEVQVIDTEKLAVGKYNLWSEGEGDTDCLGQRQEKEKEDRGIQIIDKNILPIDQVHVGGRFGRRSRLVKVDFAFLLVKSEVQVAL